MADGGLVCGQCGARNPAENNFCGRCGAFLAGRGVTEGEGWRPSDQPGEPRARARAMLIYGIAALFVLACVALSLVVIIWRP